jgi:hypothetical protein
MPKSYWKSPVCGSSENGVYEVSHVRLDGAWTLLVDDETEEEEEEEEEDDAWGVVVVEEDIVCCVDEEAEPLLLVTALGEDDDEKAVFWLEIVEEVDDVDAEPRCDKTAYPATAATTMIITTITAAAARDTARANTPFPWPNTLVLLIFVISFCGTRDEPDPYFIYSPIFRCSIDTLASF